MSALVKSEMSKLVFLLGILAGSVVAEGQSVPCVDSTRIDAWYQCNDPRFQPVCGCNRKTYRNDCVSFRNFGVNDIASDGVCREDYFFFDFYPNIASHSMQFYLQFYEQGNVTIEIRDSYGKLMYRLIDGPTAYMEMTIDLAGYRPGVYLLMVYTRSVGKYEYKRFVKV